MTLRTAIVGYGDVGRIHAMALSRSAVSELVAICDVDPDRRNAAHEAHGCPTFAKLDELLEPTPAPNPKTARSLAHD